MSVQLIFCRQYNKNAFSIKLSFLNINWNRDVVHLKLYYVRYSLWIGYWFHLHNLSKRLQIILIVNLARNKFKTDLFDRIFPSI